MAIVQPLQRYGKALLVIALLLAFLYQQIGGSRSIRLLASSTARHLRLEPELRSDPAPIVKVETETYIPPEGIFNPALPRDRPLDIVLAYYKGKASRWDRPRAVLKQHQPFWVMYRKDQVDKDEEIWDEIPMNRIYRLPNVGREGHTFVHHIIENYDNLADHTLFCQEDPHYPERIEERIGKYFRNSTGMMGLSREMKCNCDGCAAELPHLSSVWGIFTQQICDGPYLANLEGCFIVSRRRILAHDIKLYKYLKELLEKSGTQFVRMPLVGGTPKEWPASRTVFGHVLERSWSFMFDCFDLAHKPASVGPQCLDEDSPVEVKLRTSRRLNTHYDVLEKLQDYLNSPVSGQLAVGA